MTFSIELTLDSERIETIGKFECIMDAIVFYRDCLIQYYNIKNCEIIKND